MISGDLGAIYLHAVDKDRLRRYQTASEFSADVRRHLEERAVLASVPTAVYRLRKLKSRNQTLTLALRVICTLSLGLAIAMMIEAQKSGRKRIPVKLRMRAVVPCHTSTARRQSETIIEADMALALRDIEVTRVLETEYFIRLLDSSDPKAVDTRYGPFALDDAENRLTSLGVSTDKAAWLVLKATRERRAILQGATVEVEEDGNSW